MKLVAVAAVLALGAVGSLTIGTASADARVSIGIGIGAPAPYPYAPFYGPYCPYWDASPYCDYGYYSGPVYMDGYWLYGRYRHRYWNGHHQFWYHGAWRDGGWGHGGHWYGRGGFRGGRWHR